MSLIFLTTLFRSARADILFLDLNDAPLEVDAAERAANARGEKLIHVYAPVESDPSNPNYAKYQKDSNGNIRKLKIQRVEEKLRQAVQRGQQITSIVLSGHDGSGHFFGETGDIKAEEIKAMLAKPEFAPVKESLQGLALWGCYNTNEWAYKQFWQEVAPNLKVVGGFTLKSPNKNVVEGHALLENFLLREQEFVQADTKQGLQDAFSRLPHVTVGGQTNMDFGVCTEQFTVTNRDTYGPEMVYTHRELEAMCDKEVIKANLIDTYQSYFNASPGYEDPPDDSSASPSPIRKYYNQLQLWRHCNEAQKRVTGQEMPMPAQVLRLVLFKKMKGNIQRLNAAELAEYNQQLQRLGLGNLALDDLSRETRASLTRKLHAATDSIQRIYNQAKNRGANTVEADVAWQMVSGLKQTLLSLDTGCSHVSLVDERTADIPSQCIFSGTRARRRIQDREAKAAAQ
jgi:hypothetical protein